MAIAPAFPPVTVEEYLRTEYEPRCEYLDGVLKPKAMGDRKHSRLQALLISYLMSQEEHYSFLTQPELHSRVTPTRFRISDVCVLTSPPSDGRYATVDAPALFTVEIVSEGEPWSDTRDKFQDHLAMGVRTVIIADPTNKTVMLASQSEPVHELKPPLLVSIAIPNSRILQIDFDDLYSKL